MKIQTISIVTGSKACNATCPYCVSKMTPMQGMQKQAINYDRLKTACSLASKGGVCTALITGKGEPTLDMDAIHNHVSVARKYFPIVELQTNGLNLVDTAKDVAKAGIQLVSISVAHYNDYKNGLIYRTKAPATYPKLSDSIKRLHSLGISVRLSVVAFKGYIDNPIELAKMIVFARNNKVEQLTVRKMAISPKTKNKKVLAWSKAHSIPDHRWEAVTAVIKSKGHLLRRLMHGAAVYDVAGQNVCFSTCLTIDPKDPQLRQLIYFPDGSIKFDWNYRGATIL